MLALTMTCDVQFDHPYERGQPLFCFVLRFVFPVVGHASGLASISVFILFQVLPTCSSPGQVKGGCFSSITLMFLSFALAANDMHEKATVSFQK